MKTMTPLKFTITAEWLAGNLDSIKRWLLPKTSEDRWRTIEINMRIIYFNLVMSILLNIATAIKRLMH